MQINKIRKQFQSGFTIIEVLVVIAIIGILAAVVVVSYNGIQVKATDATVLSDLDAMDGLQTNYGLETKTSGKKYYSGSGYDNDLRFKPTSGNVIDVVTNSTEYCIRGYNPSGSKKTINDSFIKESNPGVCASLPPSLAAQGVPLVTIGNQTWMKYNLNVGTRLDSTVASADNGVVEKYCYDNSESNCTTYGALYTWDEAMKYTTTDGTQGICPTGSHIPSDNEYKVLEVYLGMTQAAADSDGMRGTDQGTKIRTGGSSGFDLQMSGWIWNDGTFHNIGGFGHVMTSTEYINELYPPSEWERDLGSGWSQIFRGVVSQGAAVSLRCIVN